MSLAETLNQSSKEEAPGIYGLLGVIASGPDLLRIAFSAVSKEKVGSCLKGCMMSVGNNKDKLNH
ncbi:MAG: hypothetical protein KKA62_01720 [Nanoarchaeota archaeon]|nr:hypothetical protein [Nanoarchaeota archaeon]MBU1976651.1 hypothetical protein [Nanoarchaeota archaeon]